jgi:hypothetical protein
LSQLVQEATAFLQRASFRWMLIAGS